MAWTTHFVGVRIGRVPHTPISPGQANMMGRPHFITFAGRIYLAFSQTAISQSSQYPSVTPDNQPVKPSIFHANLNLYEALMIQPDNNFNNSPPDLVQQQFHNVCRLPPSHSLRTEQLQATL